MGKILEVFVDMLFWFSSLYNGLERSRHDDPAVAQWKSYKRSTRTTLLILVGYCLAILVWDPASYDTEDYSAITASVNQSVGMILAGFGCALLTWLLGSFVLFSLHCRKHELPWP